MGGLSLSGSGEVLTGNFGDYLTGDDSGTLIPPDIAAQLARAVRQPRRDRLTEREREILALLTEGLSNREIGERLGITERTVKYHVAEILARLGASNRAQAVAIAKTRGVV